MSKTPDFEKVYRVEFIDENNLDGSVSAYDEKDNLTAKMTIPYRYSDYIIPESKLEYFKQFGKGFKIVEFVGYMPICKERVNANVE